ncbi:MAG: ion transporter [Saccharospirillum sp.]|nr:ion transporter [Saccharospirillum sp.]
MKLNRTILYEYIDPMGWKSSGLSKFNTLVCILIFAAFILTILETEPAVRNSFGQWLVVLQSIFFSFFLIEYLLRVYVATENPKYAVPYGTLHYMKSPWALLDLVALLSFLIPATWASTAFFARLARLIKIMRLARIGRFSQAWTSLFEAISKRGSEIAISITIAFILIIISSTVLYLAEGAAQPEEFGSIPRAFWWSVATLTTVGYGDVTPVTGLGKVFAGITAILGVGLVAMPTGILAAAFSEAFQKDKNNLSTTKEES